MGLRDIIAKARTSTTGAVTRHRDKIDQGIDKVGEVANARTGGPLRSPHTPRQRPRTCGPGQDRPRPAGFGPTGIRWAGQPVNC